MLDMSLGFHDFLFLLKGAGVTLLLTFWAVLLGTVAGIVLGVIRSEGPLAVSIVLGLVLDIFKSVPLLIQFVIAGAVNAIFQVHLPIFTVACLVLSLYCAAYCVEIVRGGILAVSPTTRRAGRSLGMTYTQDLLWVVFPIAIRVALPNWTSLSLGVMKDTSLVLWIGITELLRASQTIVTRTQEPLLVLGIAGLFYFILSFPIARLSAFLEKKWNWE